MLTEYDIQRLSTAICDKLCNDDKFAKRMAKLMQKDNRNLIGSTKAASILGISRKSVCEIAESLGGVRGQGKSAHWLFPEATLTEKYLRYKQQG
jgi:hypothetical protein